MKSTSSQGVIQRLIKQTNWKQCKLLGKMLDTEKDIGRRKILMIDLMEKNKDIYKSKHISNNVNIKTFNTYARLIKNTKLNE